jgi:hypothetical protein
MVARLFEPGLESTRRQLERGERGGRPLVGVQGQLRIGDAGRGGSLLRLEFPDSGLHTAGEPRPLEGGYGLPQRPAKGDGRLLVSGRDFQGHEVRRLAR